jgi:hypothetical protein
MKGFIIAVAITIVFGGLSPDAHALLLGTHMTACTNTFATGLSTNPEDCEDGLLGSFGIDVGPGVEVTRPGRLVDFGDDTITVTYGPGSKNVDPDLYVFFDITADITSLTLLTANSVGAEVAFESHAIGVLIPAACVDEDCNFTVTWHIETSAVPAPGSILIFGLGLTGLAIRRLNRAA